VGGRTLPGVVSTLTPMLVRLGERITVELGDCEQVRDGALAQPVNALSSLAFLAGGATILARCQPHRRWRTIAVGSALTLNGLGSFAYHGLPGAWTHWLHDVAIVALLAAPIGIDVGRLARWSDATAATTIAALTVAGSLTLFAAPTSTNLLAGALAVAAVGTEVAVAVRARRHRPSPRVRPAPAWIAGGALALSVVGNVTGRSTSRWCQPESLVQGHAAWHLVGALAATAFASILLDRPDDGGDQPVNAR
jgi:hypothetical protein